MIVCRQLTIEKNRLLPIAHRQFTSSHFSIADGDSQSSPSVFRNGPHGDWRLQIENPQSVLVTGDRQSTSRDDDRPHRRRPRRNARGHGPRRLQGGVPRLPQSRCAVDALR